MRFVLDTNVLVSAALFPKSIPADVLNTIIFQQAKLLFSVETKNELVEVLNRPKFNKYLSKELKESYLFEINKVEILAYPNIKVFECRDFKDNMFLELALFSKVDYIISGDLDLLVMNPFKGIPILSSENFLRLFINDKFR